MLFFLLFLFINYNSFKQYNKASALFSEYYLTFLVNEKEWEKAASLAEKYLDFETLVIICETTENSNRLDEYMDRFNNDGFSEYVYNWFLKQNRQGKLIDRYRKSGKTKHVQKLSNFLADHPSLSWMQQIFDHNFLEASDTLCKY